MSTIKQSFNNTNHLEEIFNNIDSGKEHTIVVVPSLSIKEEALKNIVGIIHYESRALWEILRASNKNTNIVFVSSLPIKNEAKNHFFKSLPNPFDVKKRVKFISPNNESLDVNLGEKILSNPETLNEVKEAIKGKLSYLSVFITTEIEHKLAKELNIPLYGHETSLSYYLTKSGNKKIFRESDVPFCQSIEDIKSVDALMDSIVTLWGKYRSLKRIMVKLDNGVSGIGNAILTLGKTWIEFNQLDEKTKKNYLLSKLVSMKFQSDKINWQSYSLDIPTGCIIEVFAEGESKNSPSAQGRILPSGKVEILSTHEQILDERGLTFLGSIFPANNNYKHILQDSCLKIGTKLSTLGFIGPFSVDFLITNDNGIKRIYVIEINIRQGGTTHPYQTTKILTNSRYCDKSALLVNDSGEEVFYMSNDNLVHSELKGTKVSKFLEFMEDVQINYNQDSGEGVVFHLLGALTSNGKLGYTSIANSTERAQELSSEVIKLTNQYILRNQSEVPQFNKFLA
ncbi:MAG: hypothetical protein ACI9QD_000008 [Thermoproteota archaeon]|jgi:hypothetical protein